MEEEIIRLTSTLGGVPPEDATLISLCQLATEEMKLRLRPGISPSDCELAFAHAASSWALAYYYEQSEEYRTSAFSAGDLSISREAIAPRIQALRDRALALMAPWSVDAGFAFQGVEG